MKITREELSRLGGIAKHKKHDQKGANNPNWKGGIAIKHYKYKKLDKKRHPQHIRARELVGRAIKSGKLVRLPCEVCFDYPSQAHHEDYSKPLEVVWLCGKRHRERHKS